MAVPRRQTGDLENEIGKNFNFLRTKQIYRAIKC